jgi:hypothetical protein
MKHYTVAIARVFGNADFVENTRLIPISFRTQNKGLGAATFTLVRRGLRSAPSDWIDSFASDPRGDLFVKIYDNNYFQNVNDPQGLLWVGTLAGVTQQVLKGTDDSIGVATANEIGWYLSQQPLRDGYADDQGQNLSHPPAFNPIRDGKYYLNRSVGNVYRTSDFGVALETSSSWASLDQGKIWSLQNVIDFIAERSPITVNVSYPKASGSVISAFTDKTKPRSYNSYYGSDLISALDELLEPPLTYHFEYNVSDGQLELYITRENDLPVTSDVASPGGSVVPVPPQWVIRTSDYRDADFTVTDIASRYDEVIIRGNRILVSGSMSPLEYQGQATLEAGWDEDEQTGYVRGSTAPDTTQTDTNVAKFIRQKHYPNVYKKFNFKSANIGGRENSMIVAEYPGDAISSSGSQQLRSFFPEFTFTDSDGNILDNDEIISNINYTSSSSKAPNELSRSFANYIPVWDGRVYLNDEDETVAELTAVLSDPLIMVPTATTGSDVIFWYDLLSLGAGGQSVALEFEADGLRIDCEYPEQFALDSDLLFEFDTTSGSIVANQSDGEWNTNLSAVSDRNPRDPEDTIWYSHWGRFIFTFAAFSDQHLEISKTRTEADLIDPSLSGPVEVVRTKVIEDESLQLWFEHEGTVRGLDDLAEIEAGDAVPLRHAAAPTIYKNDLPRAKEMLDFYSEWLFKERRAMSLSLAWDGTDAFTTESSSNTGENNLLRPGAFIARVDDVAPDGTVTQNQIDSAIQSVEWRLDLDQPRIIIQTEAPQIPVIRQSRIQPIAQRTPRMVRDSTEPTIVPQSLNSIRLPAPTKVGSNRLDTGKGTELGLWAVVGGNSLFVSGLTGIKYNATGVPTISTTPTDPLDNSLPDGFGWIVNQVTNEYRIVFHGSPYSNFRINLRSRTPVLVGTESISVTASDGSVFTALIPLNRF